MRVAIVGTGYVGLVTGTCLAERGHSVVCVDVDEERVAMVNEGRSPIHERGLPDLLGRHAGKSLRATTDLKEAVRTSDVSMVAVGTPVRDGAIDLRFVEEAARGIGAALRDLDGYHVVVMKSTVVPGTTSGFVVPILEEASGRVAGEAFGVGCNPEFLTEGQAVEDFSAPDRIVLGGIDERSIDTLAALYEGFDARVIRTNTSTAEMIKYASNAMLATAISFSNEIANLAAALGGIDVVDVMDGVHASLYLTSRTAAGEVKAGLSSFLEAGCGFGGSCLPKDARALISHGAAAGVDMRVLRSVLEVNEEQPWRLIDILESEWPSLEGRRITVLGYAFKPDTDDVRESPAVPVIDALLERGALVTVHDPVALDHVAGRFGNGVATTLDLEDAVEGADAVVLITSWDEYTSLAKVIAATESDPLVVDGRRFLEADDFARYRGIGFGSAR